MMALVDSMLKLIHTFQPGYELKFNKFYIGLDKDGSADNFVVYRVKKKHMRFEPRLKSAAEIDQELEKADLDLTLQR
jgi:hypothetical protein